MSPNAFTTDPPEPPHHLNEDAKFKWRETWPRLDRKRLDASRDRDALVQYCEAWADIRQADREIKMRAAAMERFDRAAEKLGLSLYAPQSTPWSNYCSLLMSLPQELAAQDEKETYPIALGRPRIWTCKRVWAALQRSCGNMAAAARLLSETYGVTCTRATISPLVKKYPQFREAIEDCELTLLEICKDVITDCAFAGDAASREFLLCMYHPAYQDQAQNQRT